jgi:hypothetical protein
MFVFPLIMNALQYWIIDGFIKDKGEGGSRERGYVGVGDEDADSDEEGVGGDEAWLERHRRGRRSEDGESDVEAAEREPLQEANPTAVPIRKEGGKARDREYDPRIDGAEGSTSPGDKK